MGPIGECKLRALLENQRSEQQYGRVVHCATASTWKQVSGKSSRHEGEQLGSSLGKQYYLTYQKQEGDLNAGISFSDNFW